MNENDTWPWFAEHGEFGHHMILILPPMDTPPASFTLMPRKTNKEGILVNLEELELVVPLK